MLELEVSGHGVWSRTQACFEIGPDCGCCQMAADESDEMKVALENLPRLILQPSVYLRDEGVENFFKEMVREQGPNPLADEWVSMWPQQLNTRRVGWGCWACCTSRWPPWARRSLPLPLRW